MSDEVVKPGNEEALSPNQSLSEAIKDKIFNKIYFYILVSFLLVNWQEILILFKSSEDIFIHCLLSSQAKCGSATCSRLGLHISACQSYLAPLHQL